MPRNCPQTHYYALWPRTTLKHRGNTARKGTIQVGQRRFTQVSICTVASWSFSHASQRLLLSAPHRTLRAVSFESAHDLGLCPGNLLAVRSTVCDLCYLDAGVRNADAV